MTRIADSHHIGWNIFGHDRSSTDSHVVVDGDSGMNGDAASDPYIVADSDGFCPLIASVSFNWVCAVTPHKYNLLFR